MPRYHRKGNVDAMLELASRLPWWVGLILAVVSYFALHLLAGIKVAAPSEPGNLSSAVTGSMIRTLASIGQYILPLLFVIGAAVSALKAQQARRLLAEAKKQGSAADLQVLSWQAFERLVGQAFREQGFQVAETAAGPDGGVDLELRKAGELHLVQCKRWRARKVGVEIVRELYGVMAARGAVGGYVVSSGNFSPEAQRFASGRNIELWDGAKLRAVIRTLPKPQPASPAQDQPPAAPVADPACPKCGTQMVRRVAKRGPNSGQAFWGCLRFPDCRGTRPIG